MTFLDHFCRIDQGAIARRIAAVTPEQVRAVLSRSQWDRADFEVLISPAAQPFLEEMAHLARQQTLLRFGKTIRLYAPIYLSNECVNQCAYCGFNARNQIARRTLSVGEALTECQFLHDQGFRHLLLVSGEAPHRLSIDDIAAIAQAIRPLFEALSIEIYPLDATGYARLSDAGVTGIALYQETFDTDVYKTVHKGPKADFEFRINAIERAAQAGFRELGIGALLGLADYRVDLVMLVEQANYLMKHYWRSQIAISFPRLREAVGLVNVEHPVSDLELAQAVFALRLVLPDADLVLSTRESPAFRDGMVGLGITRMSAGSKTRPGGYRVDEDSLEQFAVSDPRTVDEVSRTIEARGYEPVWKDFDRNFIAPVS